MVVLSTFWQILWSVTVQTAKQCGTCCLFKILNSCYTPFLEYIKKYATEEALKDQEEMSSSSESSISDFSEDEAQDMELWHKKIW